MSGDTTARRKAGFAAIAGIYLLAGIAGALLYRHLPYTCWLKLLVSDIAATIVVFLFSSLLGNASVYDPYWSVFPPVAALLFAMGRRLSTLSILQIAAVFFWGIRLTLNWATTFSGLHMQDWRYTMYRERTGKGYPVVSFFGIHLMPTLIVFFSMLPAFYGIEHGLNGGFISYLFVLVCFGATVLQAAADYQMHVFRKRHRGELIRTGLWTYSRHPNYLGEILMWWGIALSTFFAAPTKPWLLAGAVATNLLFLLISIPMADARQAEKQGYEEYREHTRMLLPIRPRQGM